jgi:CubicO group peptidase (beta-lactamase class C family)
MNDELITERYVRTTVATQAQHRIPALSVAIQRGDRPLWTCQVGLSGRDEAPLETDSQFRIGSITKTFTAVMVMRCRDAGLVDLDDELGRHLPVPRLGELTIRRLMSHTSGIQREPVGDVWDTLSPPDVDQLIAEMARAERVLPNNRQFHYSNLGIALLGQMVARLRGGTWAEVLAEEILRPLGLHDTSVQPGPTAVIGYLVDQYSDHARAEPATDFAAVGPAAQLWSTATDQARWAAFLADPAAVDPDGDVLAPETLDEMRWPLTVAEEALWAGGVGLTLLLVPQGDRVIHVGHDGAMPGFLAGTYGRRGPHQPPAFAAAVLGSSGTASAIIELPHTLLRLAAEIDPPDPTPWAPGEPAPPAYQSVLGRWWSEGYEYTFGWFDGQLQARAVAAPAGRPPAVFVEIEPDVLRTQSGREVGELLRLHRDDSGRVVHMHWATYRLTRNQETFDGVPASQP